MQRVGSRLVLFEGDPAKQRPQTTAAAERGRGGGAMWVPQLPLHRIRTTEAVLSRCTSNICVDKYCAVVCMACALFFDPHLCRTSRADTGRPQTSAVSGNGALIGGKSLAPSAPCTARSAQRTPRTARQLHTEQHDAASSGALLRAQIMQGMGEQERALLLKALSGF